MAAASTGAFGWTGASWWLFALLFLAPDLPMLGYAAGPRAGAAAYNLAHTYVAALGVTALGLAAGWPVATAVGLIWTAHVGLDRALGYGLKYARGFTVTHLSGERPS